MVHLSAQHCPPAWQLKHLLRRGVFGDYNLKQNTYKCDSSTIVFRLFCWDLSGSKACRPSAPRGPGPQRPHPAQCSPGTRSPETLPSSVHLGDQVPRDPTQLSVPRGPGLQRPHPAWVRPAARVGRGRMEPVSLSSVFYKHFWAGSRGARLSW